MAKINLPRDKDGKIKAGPGRPKGSKNKSKLDTVDLEVAMKLVAKRNGGKTFLTHLVERAYTSDTVAVALARKLLPDLKSSELGINTSDDLADLFESIASGVRSGGARPLPKDTDD